MQSFFIYLGGIIAIGILLWYAWGIWTYKIPSSTPASFLMWTILDSILLVTTLANDQPAWLPGGWTLGALCVTVVMFIRGKWQWSYKETICAIGALVSMYAWYRWNALAGLIAATVAMNCAGAPIWIDMWRFPIRSSWPVWFFTAVASAMTLLGSDETVSGSLLSVSAIVYNGSLFFVVTFRPERRFGHSRAHVVTHAEYSK